MTPRLYRLGTRPSPMALWQAHHVASLLKPHGVHVEIVQINTTGDRLLDRPIEDLPGDNPFTDDIEAALIAGRIDLAVHCLKDLPVDSGLGPGIAAVLRRSSPREALITRHGARLNDLPPGAVIGTSSPRRAAQVLALRPDLAVRPIRGAVDHRVRQVRDGRYDGAILAKAGLERLDLLNEIAEDFSLSTFMPAPAQGALVVQTRPDDHEARALCAPLNHPNTRLAITAELAFLRPFERDRSIAVAAHAAGCAGACGGRIVLRASIMARDGSWHRRAKVKGNDPFEVAAQAVERLRFAIAAKTTPEAVAT